MDNIRDRIPDRIARHPLAQAMALGISVTWAVALTVMGVAAVILAAAKFPPEQMKLAVILCGYVFGIGPLIIAIIVQVSSDTACGCLPAKHGWQCEIVISKLSKVALAYGQRRVLWVLQHTVGYQQLQRVSRDKGCLSLLLEANQAKQLVSTC